MIGAFAARAIGRIVSPGGERGRLLVLTYHRVLSKPDPLLPGVCDIDSFSWQMRLLARHFNVMNLAEAVEAVSNNSLPPRAICITFDDGYLDNVQNALPVLSSYNIQATFFVSTGFLDGSCMWNDIVIDVIRRSRKAVIDLSDIGLGRYPLSCMEERGFAIHSIITAIKYLNPEERLQRVGQLGEHAGVTAPSNMMMRSDDVKTLSENGMEIGGHTVSHPILFQIDDESAYDEIVKGKGRLEEIVQKPIRLFAYPNGIPDIDYGRRHCKMVERAGFNAAFTTSIGSISNKSDPFQLSRFAPWDQDPNKFILRLLRYYPHQGAVAQE